MYSSEAPVSLPATYSPRAAAKNPSAREVNRRGTVRIRPLASPSGRTPSGLAAAADRDRHELDDVGQHVDGAAAGHLRLGRWDHPVGQHGDDVVAGVGGGAGPGGPQQRQRRARAGAEREVGMVTGGAHHVHDVALEAVGDVDVAAALDHAGHSGGVGDRRDVVQLGGPAVPLQDLDLGLAGGVADLQLQHEAVALRLGQRVGALVLDRVLGRHHHERHAELVGGAVDGDLALLHGLQQRRLGLGRGPVDLVAEHDVGEDGARLELEVAALLVEDADAGHVRGQQIGGELDAPDRAVDRAGKRLGQHGLADARDVLDQQVALREQGDKGEADSLRLALDDPLDIAADLLQGFGERVHPPRFRPGRGHRAGSFPGQPVSNDCIREVTGWSGSIGTFWQSVLRRIHHREGSGSVWGRETCGGGYAKARVEDVVSRAGVGHGTFYAYFPNKRAAMVALIQENAATLVGLAAQPWRSGSVRDTLMEVLGGLADLYDRDADVIALATEASV